MRAKKLFPELTFKRLWNKITGVEKRVTTNESAISELNKNLVDQTAGQQITIPLYGIFTYNFTNKNQLDFRVELPFYSENKNYSVSFTKITVDGYEESVKPTVVTKGTHYINCRVNITSTYSDVSIVYGGSVTITFT